MEREAMSGKEQRAAQPGDEVWVPGKFRGNTKTGAKKVYVNGCLHFFDDEDVRLASPATEQAAPALAAGVESEVQNILKEVCDIIGVKLGPGLARYVQLIARARELAALGGGRGLTADQVERASVAANARSLGSQGYYRAFAEELNKALPPRDEKPESWPGIQCLKFASAEDAKRAEKLFNDLTDESLMARKEALEKAAQVADSWGNQSAGGAGGEIVPSGPNKGQRYGEGYYNLAKAIRALAASHWEKPQE
jgi:hypothetical protein